MPFGWGRKAGTAAALAGAAAIVSACVSVPETPQAEAEAEAPDPRAVCHALFDADAGLQAELMRAGSDGYALCACYAAEHAALDPDGQANMLALSIRLIELRAAKGFTTVEEAVELMEDDQDGSQYGFPWERLKAGGEPIEEAILRARRDPNGCTAS